MKLLVVTSPLVGHLFPLVATAWAASLAGHDVVVGTAGAAVEAARRAGLTVVDLAGGHDPMARFRGRGTPSPSPEGGRRGTAEEMVVNLFGAFSLDMADAALDLAADWRPDCIVHSALDGSGPLAARAHKIPLVQHTFAMGLTGSAMIDGVWRSLAPLRGKHAIDDEPVAPIGIVDPGPRSLRGSTRDGVIVSRFVPYNGGGDLPGWIHRPRRRRLCITLGTVVPFTSGRGTFATLLAAVADLDVEVVVANGRAELPATLELPPSVRLAGYLPLTVLLPTCDAVVHHGGTGSAANAVAVGIPQLALPHMADQFDVAAALSRCGVGLTELPDEATVGSLQVAIGRILDDDGLRARAVEVAAENAALPSPTETLGTLSTMVGTQR